MTHKQHTSSLQQFFLNMWYGKHKWAWLLLPISWLYQLLFFVNHYRQKKTAVKIAVPVVVVGNISVGGTGKTPIIIALAKALTNKGIKVGIISRGYGSRAPHYPYLVTTNGDEKASCSGDEPLLIATATHCPVVIDKNRVAAAHHLLDTFPEVQILLSDDGLQHYRLQRDIEIVVVDGERGLGNHLCLPAGPLREPAKRLATVDWILVNSNLGNSNLANGNNHSAGDDVDNKKPINVRLTPRAWRHIQTQQCFPLHPLPWHKESEAGNTIQAIAGIGHPQRFFNTLTGLGIKAKNYHSFDDHYQFSTKDFSLWKNDIVLMTDKDAVKCQPLMSDAAMPEQCWSLLVDIELPECVIASVERVVAER